MKKEKTLNRPSINKALFEIRNKKKLSLKEASKGLGINRLHLKLIERGYLNVSKKLEPKFISFYKLNKNFFKVNSSYITPIDVKYDDDIDIENKIRTRAKSKRTKIISGIVSILLLGAIATGTHFYFRDDINPRTTWSKEFTTFRDEIIKDHDDEEPSEDFPGDTAYYIKDTEEKDWTYKLVLPANETHASGMYVTLRNKHGQANVFAYNKKKVISLEGRFKFDVSISFLATYTKKGKYTLPKVTITDDEGSKDYYPNSTKYKEVYDYYLAEGKWFDERVEMFQTVINERYTPYAFDQLMDDVQKVSEYQVFGFRLGFRLILFPTILLVLSLAIFTYALIKGRKIKPKKEKKKPYVVHKYQYNTDVALAYRGFTNDIKFPLVVPEFVLRIIAIIILLLSSIGVTWLTSGILTGQETMKALSFNSYVSNLLVAGITLAFFLKLDINHKKSNKQLLENIVILFVFGLIFYIAECITYASLTSQGTVYSETIKLLSSLIPGNIIWNLMLYSLIFFFLFTLPKSIEDQPHKVLLWRLGSVIPTIFLLVAFIYKGTFQGVMSPYISFLFHTNGVLSTAFAIFYLYALFFFQQYVNLKYGKEFMNTFLNSRRYALSKNIIACLVLLVLTSIDLIFYFKLPVNSLNLGNNWIIAILIPLIFFYRPHIGKRLMKWDLSYSLMHIISLTGGYLVSFMMIASALDLQQLANIIN